MQIYKVIVGTEIYSIFIHSCMSSKTWISVSVNLYLGSTNINFLIIYLENFLSTHNYAVSGCP